MSEGLRVFDAMWRRLRQPNDELRPRLAAWIRQCVPAGNTLRQRRGPAIPLTVSATAVRRDDGLRAQLGIHRGPRHEFPIAPVVPVEPTAEEWDVLRLDPPYRGFVEMGWLLELVGEAWIEAGMTARGLPLYLFSSGAYRGPGRRMKWKDMLRAMAFRTTAPLPPDVSERSNGQDDLLTPPHPDRLPDTPAGLRDACRAGEPDAPLAWAEALEAAADPDSADLLRWVHGFADALTRGVRAWPGDGAFWAFARADSCWWGNGEAGTEPDENGEEAERIGRLFGGWNVYEPAVEWLLRRAGVETVRVGVSDYVTGARFRKQTVRLSAGEHFSPVDEYSGVTELWGASSEPSGRNE